MTPSATVVASECHFWEAYCDPQPPIGADYDMVTNRLSRILWSGCSRSHSLFDVLAFSLNNGELQLYNEEEDHEVYGDYHDPDTSVQYDPWMHEIHINMYLSGGEDELINTLIHEARHVMGEDHGDEAQFPDEELVNGMCSGRV